MIYNNFKPDNIMEVLSALVAFSERNRPVTGGYRT